MNQETIHLKTEAERAKYYYRKGFISREEAIVRINPYIEKVNLASVELGKLYGVKPKFVTFEGFTR